MASHHSQGIQQLLAAEKIAAEKVAEARKRKIYFKNLTNKTRHYINNFVGKKFFIGLKLITKTFLI